MIHMIDDHGSFSLNFVQAIQDMIDIQHQAARLIIFINIYKLLRIHLAPLFVLLVRLPAATIIIR